MNAFWTRIRPVLVPLLFVYVLLNLVAINLVPLVHNFDLSVTVADAEGRPMADALVGWQSRWSMDRNHFKDETDRWAEGTTDRQGNYQLEWGLQEQPYWAWPRIGTFQFRTQVLRIEAHGFEPQKVRLSDHLRGIPYRTPEGSIEVQLEPAEIVPS